MNAYIFLSNLLFLYIGFFGFLCYNGIEVKKLKVNTSKSKNAESFYIKQSYIDSNGKSTSRTIRKLGTLKELLVEHGPTRDDPIKFSYTNVASGVLGCAAGFMGLNLGRPFPFGSPGTVNTLTI